MMSFIDSHFFTYLLLPFLIFCARIMDVSIGTVRVVFVSRGYKYLAPLCGFFEVLIWLIAMAQIMKNLTNVFCYVAYASGFATGNFIGMVIEEKMALGTVLIRVITRTEAPELTEYLKSRQYGVTSVDAEGLFGKVKILFTVVERSQIEDVVASIKRYNPQAFYTIEDVRYVNERYYVKGKTVSERLIRMFRPMRKGK